MAMNENTDYPTLFLQMIVRSTEAALAAIDPQALNLDQEEIGRCLCALNTALDLPDAWPVTKELLITIASHMRWQGYRDEWMMFLERGITTAENQMDSYALAKLHHQIGWLYQQLNLYDKAYDHTTSSYNLSLQNNDRATKIAALDQLSVIASARSDFTAARSYVEQVFRLTDRDDPRRGFGWSVLGYIALLQGELEEAVQGYLESIRLHSAGGEQRLAAQSEQGLAFVYTYAGQYQQAIAHYRHVLDVFSQYSSPLDAALAQVEAGDVYRRLGDYEQALTMYRLCEPFLINTRSQVYLSHLYNNYGLTYTEIGNFDEAERSFVRSIELAHELKMPHLTANAMESLGGMFSKAGMLDKAIDVWKQGLLELTTLPEPPLRLYNLLVQRIQGAETTQRNPAQVPLSTESASR